MLDFLFSTDESMTGALSSALLTVAVDPDRPTQVYSGAWGCLSIAGQAYPCFDPVETDRYIVVVLAGPLPRYDSSVATRTEGDDGSRWILHQWKIESHLRWDEDLVGHFAVLCVDKHLGRVEAVTDINSFVPLYSATQSDRPGVTIIGSHADALALAAGRVCDVDEASVADFLIHGTVTYPYTLYRGVRQLPPASVHTLAHGEARSEHYWTPDEQSPPGSFQECASLMRSTLVHNVKRICAGQQKVGLLMSGGEDARTVATVAARATRVQGITILDSLNREARIASLVAESIGIEWQPLIRPSDHYIACSAESRSLAESHGLFVHAHLYGFAHHLPGGSRVLGGVMADAFWKGSHISGTRTSSFQFSIDNSAWEYARCAVDQLPDPVVRRATQRRVSRNDTLRAGRPLSWAEWHSLVPASMNHNLSYLFVNRRLFPSYEPFVDASMIRLSASIPQSWKINRRLFHTAVKPLLGSTRHVPHSRGFYPYYGLPINLPFYLLRAIRERVLSATFRLAKIARPNEGPWPAWSRLARSDTFRERLEMIVQTRSLTESSPTLAQIADYAGNGDARRRFRALQLLEWAAWNRQAA